MLEDKVEDRKDNHLPFRLDKSVLVKVNGEELRIGLRPIKESDAPELVKLFKENYEDAAYEVDDVYSESWWRGQVDNPRVYAQVVVTSSDRVVGSFIIDKEEEERRIIIGKVTVDPVYKGKGIANELGIIAINEVAETFEYDVMYSEARTNKPTTQRVLYRSFTRPVAVLPHKLSVSDDGLESALLMVLPNMDKRAKRKPNLVDRLAPFYEIAKETFDLSDDDYRVVDILPRYFDVKNCAIKQTKKSKFCEIKCDPERIPAKKSIENLVSERTTKGAKSFLVEVSAYNLEAQQVWLDAGFRPVGYCPAWRRIDGQREDVLFMFKGKLPDRDNITFAEMSSWGYHKDPGIWFIEPAKPLLDAIYEFK